MAKATNIRQLPQGLMTVHGHKQIAHYEGTNEGPTMDDDGR